MYKTLNTYEIAEAIFDDKFGGFTKQGAYALAEYIQQLEEELGVQFELDVVKIRCEWSQYESAKEASVDLGFDATSEEEALLFLQDSTWVAVEDFTDGERVVLVREF